MSKFTKIQDELITVITRGEQELDKCSLEQTIPIYKNTVTLWLICINNLIYNIIQITKCAEIDI